MTKKTKEKDSRLRLSPSSINTYYRCPRLFYYNYILKKRTPPNIHLYKGNFVHKVIEDVFDSTQYINMKDYMSRAMNKWKIPTAIAKRLDDPKHHTYEAEQMLEKFADRFEDKLDMLLMEKKIFGRNHAWNMAKPRMREERIHDKDLHIVGIIDSVEQDFNGNTFLIDYKTSRLYRHTISEDYIRQVKVYAYLYFKKYGKLPEYVGVHYLRYGEVFIIPVQESFLDEVKEMVHHVRENAKSRNVEDYPGCDWDMCDCHYFDEQNPLVKKGEENGSEDSV